jgi:hypothetical protein
MSSSIHVEDGNTFVSESLCFLVFRIPDDEQSVEPHVIVSVLHHHQNRLDPLSSHCFHVRAVCIELVSISR